MGDEEIELPHLWNVAYLSGNPEHLLQTHRCTLVECPSGIYRIVEKYGLISTLPLRPENLTKATEIQNGGRDVRFSPYC